MKVLRVMRDITLETVPIVSFPKVEKFISVKALTVTHSYEGLGFVTVLRQ